MVVVKIELKINILNKVAFHIFIIIDLSKLFSHISFLLFPLNHVLCQQKQYCRTVTSIKNILPTLNEAMKVKITNNYIMIFT